MGDEQQGDQHRDQAAAQRLKAARGLLLGLGVGETIGAARGAVPDTAPLRAGVCSQLACFTAEGAVRALVRGAHKGICHPPSVLWHAYCRWAALQGIERERMEARWSNGPQWPDGWLARVPVLAERRGSAPATVSALSRIEQGTVDAPATTSRGWHALGRTLPLALLGAGENAREWEGHARDVAALTHGDPAAHSAAAQATAIARRCIAGDRVPDALRDGVAGLRAAGRAARQPVGADETAEHDRLTAAIDDAAAHPADTARLARWAPDATAPSALLGGLYAAASFPDRAGTLDALRFAATAVDGAAVACVTGALLGAVHGADALPVELVSRHELAWVLDTLARDVLTELNLSPSGSEYVAGWDPDWWNRYPGW